MSKLPEPNVPVIAPEQLADLRRRAAARLTGAAAAKGALASASDALFVLHALASSPATALEALALLHELQVHQVEIDLQAQELLESRAELESALRRQIELYDFQPVGSFTMDAQLIVHELNLTGAAMLGIDRDEAFGLPLDAFFYASSGQRLRALLTSARAGLPRASCQLTLVPRAGPEQLVLASICQDRSANRYLVSLSAMGPELPDGPKAP